MDLFTDWQRRADFPAAVDAVVAAFTEHRYAIEVAARGDSFARLLDVGSVLHVDDAVANKMCALYGRALPRDLLDVDAAICSGRFTRERLLELAANADGGFDRTMFAYALGALAQITDAAFAAYGATPDQVSGLRQRFAEWCEELLKQ